RSIRQIITGLPMKYILRPSLDEGISVFPEKHSFFGKCRLSAPGDACAERRENFDCKILRKKTDPDDPCSLGNQFFVIFDHLPGTWRSGAHHVCGFRSCTKRRCYPADTGGYGSEPACTGPVF